MCRPLDASAVASTASRSVSRDMGFVKSAHFYRRVPADVSEATTSGGIISILAAITILGESEKALAEDFPETVLGSITNGPPRAR